jgi:hypothetical protein
MTGYVRKDTTNNIADGNVINAADLDAEFDGVQAAFNASTGHKHDGTASEGATINALGPTQDVTISATLVAPKTTNFVDIGSSGLKFKDMFLAGNASIGGTLAVTGVTTFTAQPILSSLTASRAVFSDGSKGLVSNAITGTGNVVMSASPTLTGTIGGASLTLSSLTSGRVTYAGTSGLLQDSANLTFNGTTLTANTLNLTNALGTTYGGTGLTSFTANGVVYASSSSALATGSALTFNGTNLVTTGSATGTAFIPSGATVPTNGMYLPTTNTVAWSTNTTERMRLDTSGNLGLGVTPSAWNTSAKAIQIKNYTTLFENSGGASILSFNSYQNSGGGYTYIQPEFASQYYQASGQHQWFTAPSGTAGNTITFTQAMTLNASGALLIGQTSTVTNEVLRVASSGQASMLLDNTGKTNGAFVGAFNDAALFGVNRNPSTGSFYNASNRASDIVLIGSATDSYIVFGTSTTVNTTPTERMRLDTSGNLGLGVTPSASWGGGKAFVMASGFMQAFSSTEFDIGSNAVYNGSSHLYAANGLSALYRQNSGVHRWYNAPSGTAGNAITFTQAMTLDSNGNLIVGGTSFAYATSGRNNIAVNGTTTAFYELQTGGVGRGYLAAGATNIELAAVGYTTFSTNNTERMRLDASGNLLVGGTSNNGYKTIITANAGGSVTNNLALHNSNNFSGTGTGSRLLFKLSNFENSFENNKFASIEGLSLSAFNEDIALVFRTQSTGNRGNLPLERMRLDESGNLLVGKTSSSANGDGAQLFPSGTVGLGHTSGTVTGTAYAAFGYAGGGIGSITQSGTTAVLYNVTSDQRLKENIVDAPEFGSVIDSLKVRSFDWKSDGNHQRAGFVAQELVTVAPEAVHQPADPEEMMAVDYSKLVPMLVKEIQSLRIRITQLENKL